MTHYFDRKLLRPGKITSVSRPVQDTLARTNHRVMCPVCLEREDAGCGMCLVCTKSYDRYALNVGTVLEAATWAAKRARRFERLRNKNRARP